MLSLFAPETVELVHFDGHNLTFRSRRLRRQGSHKVRLLVAVANRMEKLDLPVSVKSARPVPGGTECSGPVELPGKAVKTLASFLKSVTDVAVRTASPPACTCAASVCPEAARRRWTSASTACNSR